MTKEVTLYHGARMPGKATTHKFTCRIHLAIWDYPNPSFRCGCRIPVRRFAAMNAELREIADPGQVVDRNRLIG